MWLPFTTKEQEELQKQLPLSENDIRSSLSGWFCLPNLPPEALRLAGPKRPCIPTLLLFTLTRSPSLWLWGTQAHLWWAESSRSNRMSPPRWDYRKTVASHLGILFSLSFLLICLLWGKPGPCGGLFYGEVHAVRNWGRPLTSSKVLRLWAQEPMRK